MEIHPCVLQDIGPLGPLPALTALLQVITPSRASGTADHVRSLDDLSYPILVPLLSSPDDPLLTHISVPLLNLYQPCPSPHPLPLLTCMTGEETRNFSVKARALMSWLKQMAKCCRIDSTVWRGCWRVTRKYFCSGRAIDGKMAWAASYGSIGTAGPVSIDRHRQQSDEDVRIKNN